MKADLRVDIDGLDIEGAALKVAEALEARSGVNRGNGRV